MTSLIFGSIYLGHQAFVGHRHEKQRRKNYERWEGLRDEYDDQKRTQRETRSLDLQRTGAGGGFDNGYGHGADDRPILTLRDQQEANDARTGWRPQESWETTEERKIREQATGYQPVTAHGRRNITEPQQRRSMDMSSLHRPSDHRAVSMATGYDQIQSQQTGTGASGAALSQYQSTPAAAKRLSGQKTGAVWDEGLPPPLPVGRRNWDDEHVTASAPISRHGSQRASLRPSPQPPATPFDKSANGSKAGSYESLPRVSENEADVIESHVPGGFMATLIEGQKVNDGARANTSYLYHPQASNRPQPQPVSNNPFDSVLPPSQGNGQSGQSSNNPFENMAHGQQTPLGEKDMVEWWR